jgi:hypothetical protein
MNVNTFILNSIEDLFLNNDFVSSPSGISPLNCGFFALKPSRSVYQEMLEIISNSSLFSSETGWKDNTGVELGFKDVTTCQGMSEVMLF